MVAKLPASDVLRVAINMDFAGKPAVNILHAHVTLNGAFLLGGDQITTICEGIFNSWSARVMPALSSSLHLVSVDAVDLSSDLGGSGIHSGNTAGGQTTPALPANVALCVSWKEAIRYRGGHPRTYLAGICEGQLADPRHVTATVATGMAANMNQFLADVNAITTPSVTTLRVGTVHYERHKLKINPPNFIKYDIAEVNSRIDSQRRRLGR